MTQQPIRVLVVDDSAFMRKAISNMLAESPDFQVVDTARNGVEALQKVETLKPDVMTLDIDMPGMDGLTVLERVMADHPLPVLIVSSQSEEGGAVTVRALELGAVDFIPKHLNGSALNIGTIREQLHEKVRIASQAKGKIRQFVRGPSGSSTSGNLPSGLPQSTSASARAALSSSQPAGRRSRVNRSRIPVLLAIGCSTGGPQALQELLVGLPDTFPAAVVVAQHMPKFFTKPFADRLNLVCGMAVREAIQGEEIEVGTVLIAPGGQHLSLKESSGRVCVQISPEPGHLLYRPSVDLMLASASEIFGDKVLGVVLTGMGQDGLEGARAIRANGGKILAQDEASCIVYGMPKAVAEQGCVDRVVSLSGMAREIQSQVQGLLSPSPNRSSIALAGAK